MKINKLLFLTLAALGGIAIAPATRAADYRINWFTVDGGGGTSAGGAYAMSGTIGQTDAGKLAGGSYTLNGGFWGVVQTTGAPLLKIRRSNAGGCIVSWPLPSAGFILQSTPELRSPPSAIVWTDVGVTPSDDGLEKAVQFPPAFGNKFFRLIKR